MTAAQAIADLNEWTRGVFFPLAVIVGTGLLGWIAKCLTTIAGEFRAMRRDMRAMKRALIRAGILRPEDVKHDRAA